MFLHNYNLFRHSSFIFIIREPNNNNKMKEVCAISTQTLLHLTDNTYALVLLMSLREID